MANLSIMLAVAAGGAIGAVARYMVSLVAGAGGYVLLSVGLSLRAFGAGFWLLRQGGA
ncbi:MAG: hypothetical protein VW828_00640 [Candidatus Puniceispirillum sp.]